MYPYQSQIYLGEVALKVQDINKTALFYRDILGMTVLVEDENSLVLGTPQQPLVRLIKSASSSSHQNAYGLYHMAILVPSRQDLANILKHLVDSAIPLIGGADHGYSEAIYLEDPEGNGIEIYRDKPTADWDIREDGKIVGVTEELDGTALYQSAKAFVLPVDTRMGHVHLSVKDSQASSHFYQALLGLEDKFSIPTGSWLASGQYHHHLAVNEWAGKGLANLSESTPGLAYFTVKVANKEVLLAIFKNSQQLQAKSRWLSSTQLEVTDTLGIKTRIYVE